MHSSIIAIILLSAFGAQAQASYDDDFTQETYDQYAQETFDDEIADDEVLDLVLGLSGGAKAIPQEAFDDDEMPDDEVLDQVLDLHGGAAMKAMKAMKAMAAMKAMKGMKAMAAKPMKGMKAMKAMKKISARLAKRYAFLGKIGKTATGLSKSDLVKTKSGKIVSKKKRARGLASPWIAAVNKARAALKIKGFSPIKKGTPLYNKAREFYGKKPKSPAKKLMELDNTTPEVMSATSMALLGVLVASGAFLLVVLRRRTSKAGKEELLSFQF